MTPTELLSAVSEMLRALHLSPTELALWYRRRPDGCRATRREGMNIQGKIGPQYAATQQIDVYTDTRDVLAHAKRNAIRRGLQDWFICDIDAHHVETVSWKEVIY